MPDAQVGRQDKGRKPDAELLQGTFKYHMLMWVDRMKGTIEYQTLGAQVGRQDEDSMKFEPWGT